MVLAVTTFATVMFFLGLAVLAVVRTTTRWSAREVRYAVGGLLFRITLTFYYWHYVVNRPADANKYFNYGQWAHFSLRRFLTPGSSFLNNLCVLLRPIADVFQNPFLMMFVPFAIAGYAGSLLLFLSLRSTYTQRPQQVEPAMLAFFLPNLIFWSSNLGKDSIAFFGICCITYAVLVATSLHKRIAMIAVGGVILYLVRPHTVVFLAAAFSFGYFLQRGRMNLSKGIVFACALLAFVFLFKPVTEYVGLRPEIDEEASTTDVVYSYLNAAMTRIEHGATSLATGGAAIERKSTNPLLAPVYMLQFLLGPFIWQARKPIQLFSAVENILYQLMFLYLALNWRSMVRAPIPTFKWAWVLYILIAGTLMGMTYTNFGLTVRQKCMVLPALILLYTATRAYKETQRASKASLPTGFRKPLAH